MVEGKGRAIEPLMEEERLLRRAGGEEQRAAPAVLVQVLGREATAKVQVVPVHLAPGRLGDLRGRGGPAVLARALNLLADAGAPRPVAVEREDQLGPVAACLLHLGPDAGEGVLGVVAAGELGGRGDRRLTQRQGVEDALGDPDLIRSREAGVAVVGVRPPLAAVRAARSEARLHVAEAARAVDEALPPAAAGDGEAHGRGAFAQARVPVLLLGVGGPQAADLQAARMVEVGVGGGVRVGLALLEPVRPALEDVGEELLDVAFPAAPVEPVAADDPGMLLGGPGRTLGALRALAATQVAGLLLELEGAKPVENVAVKVGAHALFGQRGGVPRRRPGWGAARVTSGGGPGAAVDRGWKHPAAPGPVSRRAVDAAGEPRPGG